MTDRQKHLSTTTTIFFLACSSFLASVAQAADLAPGTTFRDYFMGGIQLEPIWLVMASLVSGLVGMAAHWWKKTTRDEVDITFMDWFIWSKFKKTLAAIFTLIAGVLASILPLEVAQTTLYSAVMLGFTMGYAADSAINNADLPKTE